MGGRVFGSSTELRWKVLEEGDTLCFKGRAIKVHCSKYVEPSESMFESVGVDKYEFCKKHYGYAASPGAWPECKKDDWVALTRVVRALFLLSEGKSDCEVAGVGGVDMELKDVKKENLKVAQEKFNEERANAEIEYAKKALREATDAIDSLDRQIKSLEEQKVVHQKVLDSFK